MTINIVLAALLAIVAVTAAAAAIRLLQPPSPKDAGRPPGALENASLDRLMHRFGRRRILTVIGAAVAGLLLALLAGWFIAPVLLPALAIVLPMVLTKPDQSAEEQLQGLADWTRKVASLIASNKPLTEAIKESVRSAPAAIEPQVKLLVTRLNARQPTADAIYAFGQELDPRAGPVIGALVLGAGHGQAGLTSILTSISGMFTNEVQQLRRIDRERAEGRNTARIVSIASVVLVAALVISPYGSPYHTPLGQLILLFLTLFFVAILWLLRRMIATRPPARIIIPPGQAR